MVRPAITVLVLLVLSVSVRAEPGALLWSDERGPQPEATSAAAAAGLADGRLVVAAAVGEELVVLAYDAATGAPLWQRRVRRAGGGVGVVRPHGRRVLVAGGGRLLDLRLESGRPVWRTCLSVGADGFVLRERQLVVVEPNGRVQALNVMTGRRSWTALLDLSALSPQRLYGWLRAAASEAGIFVVGPRPSVPELALYALDATTGRVAWRGSVEAALGVAAVAAEGGRVYLTGGRRPTPSGDVVVVLRAYDAASGAVVWDAEAEDVDAFRAGQGLLAHAGRLYVVVEHDGHRYALRAYDAADGRLLWDSGVVADEVGVPDVSISGDTLVLTATYRESPLQLTVTALDAADGAIRWQVQSDRAQGAERGRVMAIDDARAFVGGATGEDEAARFFVRAYSLR